MTKQWIRTHKHDPYYKQAKVQGYRSRAAFKLKQINNKFKVIRRGNLVLDLGAAPGGWSQVASELVGESGKVIGIDLENIKKLSDTHNVIFLKGDITSKKVADLIIDHLNDDRVDVVISDAAPNISGNYSIDQAKSIFLAEAALKLGEKLIKADGNLIIKVFEGEDFLEFYNRLKMRFRSVKKFSPEASRTRSSEIYVICKGFKH